MMTGRLGLYEDLRIEAYLTRECVPLNVPLGAFRQDLGYAKQTVCVEMYILWQEISASASDKGIM